MPSSTFQLEKQDLMNVASGGWIDSKDHNEEVKLPQAERTICAKQDQESNAESLGCDIDAADDEDDSYEKLKMTLIATVTLMVITMLVFP
eukprot:Em0004g792a